MTTQELERELMVVKQKLQQLQSAVERMSAMIDMQSSSRKSVKWVSLIGAGKEIWQDWDADKYIDAERDSWN